MTSLLLAFSTKQSPLQLGKASKSALNKEIRTESVGVSLGKLSLSNEKGAAVGATSLPIASFLEAALKPRTSAAIS